MEKKIKVSIVEDNELFRNVVIESINNRAEFEILSAYSTAEEAEEKLLIHCSDVVLLDISLPGKSGIEFIDFLIGKNPQILIIMLTIHYDDEYIFEAISRGAVGFLVKSTNNEELIKAIKDSVAGGSPMTPMVARKVLAAFQTRKKIIKTETAKLTERETEILNLLTEGLSYKEIAEKIFVSLHTVNYHLRNIYAKLQVKTRAEAVAKTKNILL